MYNGIGLTTPRGSGTNGYVQRNLAFVKQKKERIDYKTEEELNKLDQGLNKQPNREILDHERKRKVELKCMEMQELMEEQGYSEKEVNDKVNMFRKMLMAKEGVSESSAIERDEHGRPIAKESHQLAQANLEKNAKLKEAFGLSDYVEGSAFDPDRKAKEEAAKAAALAQKKYSVVQSSDEDDEGNQAKNDEASPPHKKKKKKSRHASGSPDRSKDKRKKSRKHSKRSHSQKHRKSKHRKSSKRSRGKKRSVSRRHSSSSSSSSSPSHSEESSPGELTSPAPNGHGWESHSDAESGADRLSSEETARDSHRGRSYHKRSDRRSSSSSSSSTSWSRSRSRSPAHRDSRSPSIRRRYGSPSHLDKRRITSARKRPVPYYRPSPSSDSSRSPPRSRFRSLSRSPSLELCRRPRLGQLSQHPVVHHQNHVGQARAHPTSGQLGTQHPSTYQHHSGGPAAQHPTGHHHQHALTHPQPTRQHPLAQHQQGHTLPQQGIGPLQHLSTHPQHPTGHQGGQRPMAQLHPSSQHPVPQRPPSQLHPLVQAIPTS